MYNIISYRDGVIGNPVIMSPYSQFPLPFGKSKDDLSDPVVFEELLKDAISKFRKSRVYNNYKAYLVNIIELDRCQVFGNINKDMASLEMHHNLLSIEDIAVIILNYLKNNNYLVTTFDVINILRYEHINNHVQMVMLSVTAHEMFTANQDKFFLSPSQGFGMWLEFIYRYKEGITTGIAYKLIRLIDRYLTNNKSDDNHLLDIRETIVNLTNQYSKYNIDL